MNTYDHHSYLPELIDGVCLDAGCRDFGFARHLAEMGATVIALDPDRSIIDPKISNVEFRRKALVADDRTEADYAVWSTGEGNHLCIDRDPPPYAAVTRVPCVNLRTLLKQRELDQFALVKLDIEGGEYPVLLNWPGPVAKQISVEFHDFTGMNPCLPHGDYYQRMFAHLGQWYRTVSHERTIRNGTDNFWDSLFVLKDIPCAA